jgi:hypothetical protein
VCEFARGSVPISVREQIAGRLAVVEFTPYRIPGNEPAPFNAAGVQATKGWKQTQQFNLLFHSEVKELRVFPDRSGVIP